MRRPLVLLLMTLTACAGATPSPAPRSAATTTSTSVSTVAPATTSAPSATTSTTAAVPSVITIRYRVERHTTDDATADFVDVVNATLADGRGWTRARFLFVPDDSAPYLIVLAEGDEVDRLCLPYDTYGKYSCQNGPTVALNADRWRSATPKWTGDLATYRQMVVNHEVGHLLGMKHPKPQCPRAGEPAPIMNQQSTELDGCLPNPWPLPSEIERAARHDRKLAPGPGE
ncbi:MAG: hypothetical protein QOK28_1523 [Actinomycetota bacterium]